MKALISASALLFLAGVPNADAAKPAAWCVFYDPSTYNCGFSTYQQCMETARGAGGFCRPNPFERPNPTVAPATAELIAPAATGSPFMLSVVIATHDSERLLLPTLAALVPGAAAGTVREVIVADADSSDATAEIADVAGCRFLSSRLPRGARLNAAAATARSNWLLFLQPGMVPDVTWIEETRRFVEDAEINDLTLKLAAVFRRGQNLGRSPVAEALSLLRDALGVSPLPQQGLLIAKRFYNELSGHDEAAAEPERQMYRRIGRRRTVLLRCGAAMVT